MSNEFTNVIIPDMIKEIARNALGKGQSADYARQRLTVIAEFCQATLANVDKVKLLQNAAKGKKR